MRLRISLSNAGDGRSWHLSFSPHTKVPTNSISAEHAVILAGSLLFSTTLLSFVERTLPFGDRLNETIHYGLMTGVQIV
jgi:CHASE1-domain containing sensor protein